MLSITLQFAVHVSIAPLCNIKKYAGGQEVREVGIFKILTITLHFFSFSTMLTLFHMDKCLLILLLHITHSYVKKFLNNSSGDRNSNIQNNQRISLIDRTQNTMRKIEVQLR